MRVGETLDAAINLYRRNWRTFLGVVALIIAPWTFLVNVVVRASTHPFEYQGEVYILPGDVDRLLVITFGSVVVYFVFIQPLLTAAMVRAVSDSYLGREPTVRESYRFAFRRIWSVLLVVLLVGLAVSAGFVALIVPGVIIYVRLLMATPAVVVEDARGRAALRRSWHLSRGFGWRLFGTVLVANLLASLVGAIFLVPASLVSAAMGPEGWLVDAIGSGVSQILTTPFTTTIPVLLYFDARIRKEGMDLAIMAREVAREPGAP